MIRRFDYTFEGDLAQVFSRLIHCAPNYDKELQKYLKSYTPLFESGVYKGYEMDFDIGGELAFVRYEVSFYEEGREVRYLQKYAKLQNGDSLCDRDGFPYSILNMRYLFYPENERVRVTTEYHLIPKGLFGWLFCFFYVFPSTKRQTIKGYKNLQTELSSNV